MLATIIDHKTLLPAIRIKLNKRLWDSKKTIGAKSTVGKVASRNGPMNIGWSKFAVPKLTGGIALSVAREIMI